MNPGRLVGHTDPRREIIRLEGHEAADDHRARSQRRVDLAERGPRRLADPRRRERPRAVVNLHPGVLECAAIGIADTKSGEAVKLFVVKNDSTLSEEDISSFCRDNFTAYKRPKYIEFREELPKSNVGKILRRELRPAND